MAAVPLDTRIRRGPVLWRRSGAQILIRRRGDDRLTVLAGTGVALWDELVEPVTLETLAARLAAAHAAPVETVTSDLQASIETLLGDGVVVRS